MMVCADATPPNESAATRLAANAKRDVVMIGSPKLSRLGQPQVII
jgi:hypothetical protein